MIYRSPRALAEAQERRALYAAKSVRVTHEALIAGTVALMRSLLGGAMSYQTMRFFGHPYGRGYSASAFRRHNTIFAGSGTQLALPINMHTGELLRSLRVFRRAVQGVTVWQIQFTSPHAVVLTPGGTKTMIDRGFWRVVNEAYLIDADRAARRAAQSINRVS